MSDGNCPIEGCELEPLRQRGGYCRVHYAHWKRYGDPLVGDFRPYRQMTEEQRFWSYVDKTPDCWIWTGPVRDKARPYGRFQMDRKKVAAHRYSYELHIGQIPEGMYLDHICHNPPCVNPEHLRPVTSKQNQENQRGIRADNTSGYRGVCWDSKTKSWRGYVHHAGERLHLGVFPTAELAHEAVKAKRIELYTHNDADRASA